MGRNCSETIPHKYGYALVEEMRGVAPPVFQHNGGAASLFKRSDLRLSSDKSWSGRDSYDRAGVVVESPARQCTTIFVDLSAVKG